MTTVSVPKFSYGGVAFRYTIKGQLQAWKVFDRQVSRGVVRYKVIRDGLLFWESEDRLLTGWEADFPGLDAVDWGTITPIYLEPTEYPEPDDEAEPKDICAEYGHREEDLQSLLEAMLDDPDEADPVQLELTL